MRVQQLVHRYVRRRLDGDPRHVTRRARQPAVELAHDDERRDPRDAGAREPADQRLRLSVAHVERLDRGQFAGRDLRGDRSAQRLAPHRARHVLVVFPRRRSERLAAALPLDGTRRALPRAAGPLLLPRLAPAARDLAAAASVVRAGATVGQLAGDSLMEERHTDLRAEDVSLQLDGAGGLPLCVQYLYGRHRYFFSATFCCCALVALTDFRSITSVPLAPGTAP